MPADTARRTRRRLAVHALSALAGVVGGVQAYGFGEQIGGALVGWVTGLNGAAICALLVGAALDRLVGRRPEGR